MTDIFPEGSPLKGFCTREMAAKTVFVFLYIGAVDGADRYLAPKHVIKMSDEQVSLTSDAERLDYYAKCRKSGFTPRGAPWYADNTREPIRDETLRHGLIRAGAVAEKEGVPTTSPKGRYFLAADFAALFDPCVSGRSLEEAIKKWQSAHLSAAGLARLAIVRHGRTKGASDVVVRYPNGDSRRMKPGESSVITKQVVEEFAPRFLDAPAVIWVSESSKKVVASDDELARALGLDINPARNLPDIILADVRHDKEVLLVFVEVVATDGPISEQRKSELLKLCEAAEIPEHRTAFVTAYLSRDAPAVRKNLPGLAWNSFVWFANEPENIVAMYGGNEDVTTPLHSLLLRTAKLKPLD